MNEDNTPQTLDSLLFLVIYGLALWGFLDILWQVFSLAHGI